MLADGRLSQFFAVIGYVVIIALACSIVESQLILPSHLAHRSRRGPSNRLTKSWTRFQGKLAQGLENVASGGYQKFLLQTLIS